MKDSIYTIPISEVFEIKKGCPICIMRDRLEKRCIEYIMGAAMMEPDIRIETNKQGFCDRHFAQMMQCRNRLSIGLILQSHLEYIDKEIFSAKTPIIGKDKSLNNAAVISKECYVCNKINWALERMIDTIFKVWAKEESFKTLYSQQEVICFEHYEQLSTLAVSKLGKKIAPEFISVTKNLSHNYLKNLRQNITSFCNMFDYRNAGSNDASDTVKASIEDSVNYLTGNIILEDDENKNK